MEGGRRSSPLAAWKAWGPAVTWAAVLFLLSEISTLPRAVELPDVDKVAHFGLYFLLGAALGWGYWASAAGAPHWLLVGLGVLYGVVDEWHQSFVPRRTPELGDFAVDVLGVAVGYILLLFVLRRLTGN